MIRGSGGRRFRTLLLLAAGFAIDAPAVWCQASEEVDPPEVAIGERLFLETRFANLFFVQSHGDANAVLDSGDPVLDVTETPAGPLMGPFTGQTMNCRACHLVDEQSRVNGGGNRSYSDFARRSPIPVRDDGETHAVRNSPSLVGATRGRPDGLLLHFDGEFATAEDLVAATLTGRNFGWLPTERSLATRHIATIIRDDDGEGELASEFGGGYRVVLTGTDPSIPRELRLPAAYRIDVAAATEREILDGVAKLIRAYLDSLAFAMTASGEFDGSPYDRFLAKNRLPRQPRRGESDRAYAARLLRLVEGLGRPQFVTASDGAFVTHEQVFSFGPAELEGLKLFLRTSDVPGRSPGRTPPRAVGNCAACHAPPHFTDSGVHNTGATQEEYDAVHGDGSFVDLRIPDLAARQANPDAYLPPTPAHPRALGPFRAVPSADDPGRTDLGLWNVLANPELPAPQHQIQRLLCEPRGPCSRAVLLQKSVARFMTPSLRDLGHSGPYLHTGRFDSLDDVIRFYTRFAALARSGQVRNAARELAGITLGEQDVMRVAAFLRALNEDYE
jgi:cytochrome c peroxidase